jgi:hypothetical protein
VHQQHRQEREEPKSVDLFAMIQRLHAACAREEMAQTSRALLRLCCDVVAVERGSRLSAIRRPGIPDGRRQDTRQQRQACP